MFLKPIQEERDCYLKASITNYSLQCRRIWGGRKLLVYVRTVEAAIFDFMTEEDWGEFRVNIRVARSPHFLHSFGVLKWRFHE